MYTSRSKLAHGNDLEQPQDEQPLLVNSSGVTDLNGTNNLTLIPQNSSNGEWKLITNEESKSSGPSRRWQSCWDLALSILLGHWPITKFPCKLNEQFAPTVIMEAHNLRSLFQGIRS